MFEYIKRKFSKKSTKSVAQGVDKFTAFTKIKLPNEAFEDEYNHIIIARNLINLPAAYRLAQENGSKLVLDLDDIRELNDPNNKELVKNGDFKKALTDCDLILCHSRNDAKILEKKLKRPIAISRHTPLPDLGGKKIDLKKMHHLVDDTKLMHLGIRLDQNDYDNSILLIEKQLSFVSLIMKELPGLVHLIISGGKAESDLFRKYSNIFKATEIENRVHFHLSRSQSIRFPMDYRQIDIGLHIDPENLFIPKEYYRYKAENTPIFTTDFDEADLLVTGKNIGKIFDKIDVDLWKDEIFEYLFEKNYLPFKMDDFFEANKNLNWEKEAAHIKALASKNLYSNSDQPLKLHFVDLDAHDEYERSIAIAHKLEIEGKDVAIFVKKLPLNIGKSSNDIEYILA